MAEQVFVYLVAEWAVVFRVAELVLVCWMAGRALLCWIAERPAPIGLLGGQDAFVCRVARRTDPPVLGGR